MVENNVQLIRRILSGDDAAFSTLMRKHQKGVHALIWRKIGDFHIAEEITQDTFIQVYKKLGTLEDPNRFEGWLYVIANRRCINWIKRHKVKMDKLNMQSLEDTHPEEIEKASYEYHISHQRETEITNHRQNLAKTLLQQLPESERTIVTLHYLGKMTSKEIGKFLGVSVNTIKSRLRRARKRLQKEGEILIRETLNGVQLSDNIIENVMRQIADLNPTPAPPTKKPLLPLAAFGAAVVLVILFGMGSQYLIRSQQPYSFDAQSEPTIEIVDTPVLHNIISKPDVQNRVGSDTIPGRNSNKGLPTGTKSMENNIAQESMQWNLPEDAKARLGKGKISEIQYSSDGALLVVATGIGIWLYDTTTYQEVALLTAHTSAVKCLAFSPDGHILASGGEDGTILLWHRSTGAQKVLTESTESVSNLAFSPDGQTLANGSVGTIRFWDPVTGEQKGALTGLPEHINNLSFSPDGKTIVSVTWGDGEVCISDVITGKPQKTFTVQMTDNVFSVAFSPDSKIVAIGNSDGIIYLSDLNTGKLMRKLTGHSEDVQRVVFSPDGKTLASSSYLDETVRLWDAHTGEHRLTLTEHTGEIEGLAFSPDGKTLASSGSGDGTIRFWDVRTGNEKHAVTGHTGDIHSVAFNPDGKFVASGHDDGVIRFWDAETGLYLKTFKKGYEASGLVFSEDGKTLAYADGLDICLQDAGTGEEKMLLTGHTWGIHSMALSPDGNILASGSEDMTIRLWDMHTGEHKKTFNGHTDRVYSVAFSPDGKTLASGSDDNTLRLWSVDTGETERILTGHAGEFKGVDNGPSSVEGVKSVAFSPDGKTLASGGGDNVIHLWDVETGKSKIALIGHTHWVFSLAFSPDGKTLASGSVDSDIRLWDAHTGEHKKTLNGHSAWVRSIAFSSDGKTLVSGSDDGSVLLWKIDL